MADAGYSAAPLIKKLGIKPGMKILVIHVPENYFQLLDTDISKQYAAKNEMPDLIHHFAKNSAVFKKGMDTVLKLCKKNSLVIVWVS